MKGFTNIFVVYCSPLCRSVLLFRPIFFTCIMNKRHVKNFAEVRVEQGKESDTAELNGGNNPEIVSV